MTSVFLPGKSHGQRSLVGYNPWGCKESVTTEHALLLLQLLLCPTYHGLRQVFQINGLLGWLSGKESSCQCKEMQETGVWSLIPWRWKWQPTPAFLPGESHGQRSLAGYSPWNHKELDTTEQLTLSLSYFLFPFYKLVSWRISSEFMILALRSICQTPTSANRLTAETEIQYLLNNYVTGLVLDYVTCIITCKPPVTEDKILLLPFYS